jgi:hypothetical protein
MDKDNNSKNQREITYRVGWKTGKIQWDEHTKVKQEADVISRGTFGGKLLDFHTRFAWRQGMKVPSSLVFPLLYLLPLTSFICTVVLVYMLTHH